MGVYGVALAGWASNNKYSLLGGLRSSAQMISYELPMALAIAAPLLLPNTLSLREIVDAQAGYYLRIHPALERSSQGPFPQIFSFIIFMIAAFAETNRMPFDLPEAENELVAGFHAEYSSMKFAAFFMAEYANMVTVSCIATLLFLGGWQPLWPAEYGSNFVPPLIFAIAGADLLLSRPQPGAAVRPLSRCRCSASSSSAWPAIFLVPIVAVRSDAAVLVSAPKSASFCSCSSGFAPRCRASATTS